MADLDNLLNARGVTQTLGAHVTAVAFNRTGSHAAFALGDGTIRLTATDSAIWTSMDAHAGAVLALAPDHTPDGFLSGGDDGKFLKFSPGSTPVPVETFGMKWVEHAASFSHPKAPLLACAVGKNLHLYNGLGEKLRSFPHPSTVTGIAFDSKGKRLAASHYNGASLWFTASNAQTPKFLEWKGSHTGIALHPHGDALVTSMQENALHGWTLPEGKHMRMSGYPAKVESFGFTSSGKWLATGGADAIVLWPFFGGGPMGKPPTELGQANGVTIKRLACHPEHEILAAGYENGLIVVADVTKEKILTVCGPGRGSISALSWNPTGSHLAFGTAAGFAAVVDFSTPS